MLWFVLTFLMNRRLITSFIIILVIVALCLIVDLPKGPDFDFSKIGMRPKEGETEDSLKKPIKLHLGLDLSGGSELTYKADLSNRNPAEYGDAMAGVRDVIERRINLFGVSEPVVQVVGKDRLIVELAGVKDIDQAISAIGETPTLEFWEESGDAGAGITGEKTNEEATQNTTSDETNRAGEEPRSSYRLAADSNNEQSDASAAATEDPPANGEVDFDPAKIKESLKSQFPDLSDQELDDLINQINLQQGTDGSESSALASPGLSGFKPTNLTGEHLEKSEVVFEQQGVGKPQVSLEFNDEGKELFSEITKRNISKRVAIVIDGVIISAPTVQTQISDGRAVITGNFSIEEAKELAINLNAGALPVPIELVSRQTVGPTLGKESIQKSLIAGVVGMIAVIIFMIGFYRWPGVLASIVLIIYALIVLALFKLIPVTLTLAGVAGFILSIGMAVDANVLIFERLKEELRQGRSLSSSLEIGFKSAWPSIRDSNFTTLISCFFLYYFGTSIIKGFALTLGIGVLISMFSAVIITRTFLRLSVVRDSKKFIWWFGVERKAVKASKQ